MAKPLDIKHLDRAVRPLTGLPPDLGVQSGWIEAVRRGLGMPAKTLARRLDVTAAQATRFSQREVSGGITLASLRRVADALECDLVYAFVPRGGSFQSIVERQARDAARQRLGAVEQTMKLEAQPVDDAERERQLDELTHDLVRERPAWIWDAHQRR